MRGFNWLRRLFAGKKKSKAKKLPFWKKKKAAAATAGGEHGDAVHKSQFVALDEMGELVADAPKRRTKGGSTRKTSRAGETAPLGVRVARNVFALTRLLGVLLVQPLVQTGARVRGAKG